MTILNLSLAGQEKYAAQFEFWCRSGNYSNYKDYYDAFKPYFDYNMEDSIPAVYLNIEPKVLKELYGNEE